MKCRINRCLLVAVVFTLAAGSATTPSSLMEATPSPLMEAASKGDTEKVQALLAKGADVNAKTNYGTTTLMTAKKKGHKKIVQLLKKAGAKE